MKKLLTIASVLAVFTASSAFAKTEGHYVGISIIDSKTIDKFGNGAGSQKANDRSTNGFGIDYKYAFSLSKNVFLAPGAFFDKFGLLASDSDKARYRYGVKLDLGYDLTHKVALYFTNGLANTNYYYNNGSGFRRNSTDYMDYFYGAGVSYSPLKNVSFKVEYTTQRSELRASAGTTRDTDSLRLWRFGAAYRF